MHPFVEELIARERQRDLLREAERRRALGEAPGLAAGLGALLISAGDGLIALGCSLQGRSPNSA